jgi:hypothetical protein
MINIMQIMLSVMSIFWYACLDWPDKYVYDSWSHATAENSVSTDMMEKNGLNSEFIAESNRSNTISSRMVISGGIVMIVFFFNICIPTPTTQDMVNATSGENVKYKLRPSG